MPQAPGARPESSALADREVAITGRLASMTREEARNRIEEAGGRYAEDPGLETSFLVVGQGGPPLDEQGRPTGKLRRARELAGIGHTLEVVPELRFLELIGLEQQQGELHRLYTTSQLARILDLPASTVRTWVRHGLIRPVRVVHRLSFFDFPQVATARSLSQLARAGVTPQRLRRSLEELTEWFPDSERALDQLQALEHGRELLVRTPDGQLAETSGQLRLDFEEAGGPVPRGVETPTPVLRLTPLPESLPATERDGPPSGFSPAGSASTPTNAHDWFERGVDAEERNQEEQALTCYLRALTIDPDLPEACFNLGNVLYAQERRGEAADYYARTLELDPEYVEAWNNLGIVQSELSNGPQAIQAFRRALGIAPDYADAHFNLAETFAALGDVEAARRHWRAYLNLDPTSPWSVKVRERLRSGAPGGLLLPHRPATDPARRPPS